ncbi:MAG: hypothetical protein ACF8PG_01225 [Maioricimonas sp. JB045]
MTRPRRENETGVWPRLLAGLSTSSRRSGAPGAMWAGLFFGTALVTSAAEPVLAPPASEAPAIVTPPFAPPQQNVDEVPPAPETVRLLAPESGDGPADRISRVEPDVDLPRQSGPRALPPLTPAPPGADVEIPTSQRPSDPIVERAEMLQRDKEQRFNRLRGQLEDLITRWEEQQERLRSHRLPSGARDATPRPRGMSPAGPADVGGTPPSVPLAPQPYPPSAMSRDSAIPQDIAEPSGLPSPGLPSPGQPGRGPQTMEAMRPTPPPPEPAPDTGEPAGIPGVDTVFADPVVAEGPIDRLGLADSLFASGEHTLALELYRQLEGDGESLDEHDRYWVSYQIACCFRRLDNIDEAQKWYRHIVADKNAGWVGELAGWWLDHLEERTRVRGDVQGLVSFIKSS